MNVKWRLWMAAADGRGAARGLDRRAAASAARGPRGTTPVFRLGIGTVREAAAQVKLETVVALCTALECTPNDLFEVHTTPVTVAVEPARTRTEPKAARGRSMPPL